MSGKGAPRVFSFADEYLHGGLDLHLYVRRFVSRCAVYHCSVAENAVGRKTVGRAFVGDEAGWADVADHRIRQTGRNDDQLTVLVGILKRIQDRKRMVLGSFLGAEHVWLQPLEKRYCIVWQASRHALPTPSGVRMYVLPRDGIHLVDIAGEDRELRVSHDLTRPAVRRHHCACNVVKGGPCVEHELADDDLEEGLIGIGEADAPDSDVRVVLVFEPFGHRVRAPFPKRLGQLFEVTEVLLRPKELEPPRAGHYERLTLDPLEFGWPLGVAWVARPEPLTEDVLELGPIAARFSRPIVRQLA